MKNIKNHIFDLNNPFPRIKISENQELFDVIGEFLNFCTPVLLLTNKMYGCITSFPLILKNNKYGIFFKKIQLSKYFCFGCTPYCIVGYYVYLKSTDPFTKEHQEDSYIKKEPNLVMLSPKLLVYDQLNGIKPEFVDFSLYSWMNMNVYIA